MRLIQATVLTLMCITLFTTSRTAEAYDSHPSGRIEEFTVAFAPTTPLTYTRGSGVAIRLTTRGLPRPGQALIVSAWNQGTQVAPGFSMILNRGPWTIPASQMDKLPAGDVQLRVEPLGGRAATRRLQIIAPEAADEAVDDDADETEDEAAESSSLESDDDAWMDDGQGDQVLAKKKHRNKNKNARRRLRKHRSNGNKRGQKRANAGHAGKGFTDFKTQQDSKVVYVPSGGSIKNGYDQLRNGYPDHLLLQAGGTYHLGSGIRWAKSGRSEAHPMVLGVVGKGDRPVIHCSGSAISFSGTVRNTAFVGLHLTADPRNPGHRSYRSDVGRFDGFELHAPAINLTIEDCVIEYFTHGIMLEGANDVNVRIHRSIIRNSWSQSSKGHSQGLYAYRTNGLTITDSVFDRNGWEPRASGGGRTIFNHNIYVIGIKNMVIQNSIFTRGSSNGMNIRTGFTNAEALSNVTVRGNILIDNANAIGVGNKTPKVVSDDLVIEDNVICRQGTVLNNAAQSMGIGVTSFKNIEVSNNYFIDKPFGGTSFAVKLESSTYNGKVNGNVVHNWALSESAVQTKGKNQSANGNFVNRPASAYANAGRTLNTYMNAIGAKGGTSEFIGMVTNRRRGTWDPRPYNFNKYIQQGFKRK